MFAYTVFYFMVQYYGNEKFDDNNEVWKFWQIELNKLHSIKFIGLIIIFLIIILCHMVFPCRSIMGAVSQMCIYM